MTKILSEPRCPAENWQGNLAAWIAEVKGILRQAMAWAEKRGWATREDEKVITEDGLGTYQAPTLLLHLPQGRLLLEPVARYVVGADGRLDFCVMPSYDAVPLVRADGAWGFLSPTGQTVLPWSEEAFEKVARELLSRQ